MKSIKISFSGFLNLDLRITIIIFFYFWSIRPQILIGELLTLNSVWSSAVGRTKYTGGDTWIHSSVCPFISPSAKKISLLTRYLQKGLKFGITVTSDWTGYTTILVRNRLFVRLYICLKANPRYHDIDLKFDLQVTRMLKWTIERFGGISESVHLRPIYRYHDISRTVWFKYLKVGISVTHEQKSSHVTFGANQFFRFWTRLTGKNWVQYVLELWYIRRH